MWERRLPLEVCVGRLEVTLPHQRESLSNQFAVVHFFSAGKNYDSFLPVPSARTPLRPVRAGEG